jgi:hypothetical protein
MTTRTEEDALSGLLRIRVGGQPVELPVLTIEQSEAWLTRVAQLSAGVEVPDDGEPEEQLRILLTAPLETKLDAVLAFDVTGRLGDREHLLRRMTPIELDVAFDAIALSMDPSGEVSRLVAAAVGTPTRLLAVGLQAMRGVSRPASSPSSPSPNGDSTHALSVLASPESNSSSSGTTDNGAVPVRLPSNRKRG